MVQENVFLDRQMAVVSTQEIINYEITNTATAAIYSVGNKITSKHKQGSSRS